MSSDNANADATLVVVYDVLFYKRAAHSKVHKSKGVSKIDGTLSIHVKQNTISLRCAEDGEEEEDDDEQKEESSEDEGKKKTSWKDRRKKAAKSAPRGVVYSGKPPSGDMTLLQEDSILVLGTYEVEIVACRTRQAKSALQQQQPLPARAATTHAKSMAAKTTPVWAARKTTTTTTTTTTPLLPVKRKQLAPQPLVSQTTATVAPTTHAWMHRRPPPQPRQRPPPPPRPVRLLQKVDNVDSSLDTTVTKTAAPSKPRVAGTLLRRPHHTLTRRTTVTASTKAASAATQTATTFQVPTASQAAVLPHIPLPGAVRQALRPHQIDGVDFLWRALRTQHNKGAILADEMGLGKTLQSIAVVSAWYRTQRSHSHIVVCPSSLVRNWEDEFDKWIGKAGQPRRMVIRTGGADGLHLIRSFAENQSHKRSNRVGQVLIVSYDLFRRHTRVIQQAVAGSIGLLVCDEAHRLKNTAGSQTMTALDSLQAESRLLISASPVQNNLSEFYSLVNFARPGLLGELSTFRKEFERPIVAANRKNATPADKEMASRQSHRLEALTKSTILRRLQSEILARTLPPRTEILLFCKLSNAQMRLYQSAALAREKQLSFTDALETLTNLRKLCTHPSLLSPSDEGEADLMDSGKLLVLSTLLLEMRRSSEENKVVVVSNFTSALSLIEELILKPNNLAYLRLDGNVPAQKRQMMVDTFNRTSASRSFCFLLSAKAGGCGLNLVGANNLVLFEPDWNPSTDLQCMGRVYRTGQKRPTAIYRLFSTGTLEEIIYQRQLQKGDLASVTVDGREEQTANFSPEELKECMTLKLNTLSDTKDKIGASWRDSKVVLSSLTKSPETASAQALESLDVVTYAHVVDTDAVVRAPRRAIEAEEETYASDTSEEEFEQDDTLPKRVKMRSNKSDRFAESGSEDNDGEFEFS